MKSLKLKKILAMALVAASLVTVAPVSASAEWRQDSSNKWNWTENGSKATGWKLINGSWYRFDSQGTMYTGWINEGGTWYYTDNSGAMKTGWVMSNGVWYFTDNSGAMKTGWVNDNGTWYFTNASGAMLTGVVEVDGKVYCLSASGAMLTGNVMINGVVYTFAATGEAVGNIPKADKSFNISDGKVTITTPNSTGSSSSSGGGSSHNSSYSTIEEKLNTQYKDAATVLITKVDGTDNQYKVSFKENNLKLNGHDYVTRDLYVTDINGNNDEIDVTKNEDDGSYIVTDNNKKGVKIRGVIRVVDSGKIYYVTK